MSGIFPGDAIIRTMIELGIEDMRKNEWLIDHMLGDFIENKYLRDKYGKKQVDACKEWFRNNQIDVVMAKRNDHSRLPQISIEMGPGEEKSEMKTMADQSVDSITLMPNTIGKPIPYVVKPFALISYDETTGLVAIPANAKSVAPGMILVNPANGNGYPIIEIDGDGVYIQPETELEDVTHLGIVPKYQFYKARIEHTYMNESYNIGCHAHGDPQTVLWLHSIALYSIFRYRESLLEANGFAESSITSSPPDLNAQFTTEGGEIGWSRGIRLTGQIEQSWIKSPRRFIENVLVAEPTSTGYDGGIKIISNEDSPPSIDRSTQTWYTIDESDE